MNYHHWYLENQDPENLVALMKKGWWQHDEYLQTGRGRDNNEGRRISKNPQIICTFSPAGGLVPKIDSKN